MSQNTSAQQNIKPPRTNKAEKKPAQKRSGPKKPKRISESYLHNSGLYYLERYSASSAHFTEVMLRKVKKSCAFHQDQNYDECAQMVRDLTQKLIRLEILNDDLYARGQVRALRGKGKSKRFIQGQLKVKGVPPALIEKHMALYDEEHGLSDRESEREAALTFARKKRLGPFRTSDRKTPEQELGSMARAGFSYDIARSILELNEDEVF